MANPTPARLGRPERDEAADYYFKYIDLVRQDDIRDVLESQRSETTDFLHRVPPERGEYAYADDKWTFNGVLAHVNDCERLFAFRAFWFARGLEGTLPSFDQQIAAKNDQAATRTTASLIEEFDDLRRASVDFFRHLPEEAWLRRGVASDSVFSVRALAFIAAGHVIHHTRILKSHYL